MLVLLYCLHYTVINQQDNPYCSSGSSTVTVTVKWNSTLGRQCTSCSNRNLSVETTELFRGQNLNQRRFTVPREGFIFYVTFYQCYWHRPNYDLYNISGLLPAQNALLFIENYNSIERQVCGPNSYRYTVSLPPSNLSYKQLASSYEYKLCFTCICYIPRAACVAVFSYKWGDNSIVSDWYTAEICVTHQFRVVFPWHKRPKIGTKPSKQGQPIIKVCLRKSGFYWTVVTREFLSSLYIG